MRLSTDGYEFDFANAIALYKFDEPNKASNHYHGLSHCMKAVDVVAEFPNFQVWIEIKDYPPLQLQDIVNGVKGKSGKSLKLEILDDLKQKFRDTVLYRECEGASKQIVYICLVNFKAAECASFCKELKLIIPSGKKGPRWTSEIVSDNHCFVVDANAWNRNFQTKIGTCTKQLP